MICFLLMLVVLTGVSCTSAQGPPAWKPNFDRVGMMYSGGEEASPLFMNGKLYIMSSQMGFPTGNRSDGAHSFFCVNDAITGERVSCPESSSGWAFCSAIIDRTATPERAWVFCSAWDRANHTINGQNHSMVCGTSPWGCGGCALAMEGTGPGCSVGSWSSDDLQTWDGPHPAVTLPGNVTVPNVGVSMIPVSSRQQVAAQTGLPMHQAYMVLESRSALAINVGTDRDLSKNWQLVPMRDGFTSFGLACPTTRFNHLDNFFYVFGGGADIVLTRSKDLKTWTHANNSMASGCISESICLEYRKPCANTSTNFGSCCASKPDCARPSDGGQIAPGYFVNYWANYSDCRHGGRTDCDRSFLTNESEWNWSVNDADFTDEGGKGPTRFIYDLSQQTKPLNFSGASGGGYQLGVYNGTELQWLQSFYTPPSN
eukprot:m.93929 g.93929  ORF g.93929 m.93929 type:complete len:428 (+) comp26661_c0_seq1:139-1422(+)